MEKEKSKNIIIGVLAIVLILVFIMFISSNSKKVKLSEELAKIKSETEENNKKMTTRLNDLEKSYTELESMKNALEEKVKLKEMMQTEITSCDSITVELKNTIEKNPKYKSDTKLKMLINALDYSNKKLLELSK